MDWTTASGIILILGNFVLVFLFFVGFKYLTQFKLKKLGHYSMVEILRTGKLSMRTSLGIKDANRFDLNFG